MHTEETPLVEFDSKEKISNFSSLICGINFKVTLSVTFLFSYIYSFSSILLSIYYIEILDLDDKTAGIFISLLSLQALTLFLPGIMIKKIGIKLSYIITSVVSIILFVLVVLIESPIIKIILLTFVFSLTPTVFFPCTSTSTVADTTMSNRSLGFSLLNAMYCFATVFLSLISELIFTLNGFNKLSFKIIFGTILLSFLTIIVIVTTFYKNPVTISNENSRIPLTQIMNLKRYWKTFIVLLICAIPIACSFTPGIILPIYYEREFNETSKIGYFIGAYYIILGILSPTLDFINCYFTSYNSLILGATITGFGHGLFIFGNNNFILCSYIVITATGGAILQSQYMNYNANAAIKGLEGHFYGILVFSYSVAHFIIGLLAGFTLKEFCPKSNERYCWAMWITFSLASIFVSLLMFFLKPLLEVRQDNEETNPYIFSSHLS